MEKMPKGKHDPRPMKILTIQEDNDASEFEVFLNKVSGELAAAICKKIQGYTELDDIYIGNCGSGRPGA